MSASPSTLTSHAQSVDTDSSTWIERTARFGYAAKGVVYTAVGILSLQAALGSGGATAGSSDAIRAIAQQPFGRIMLGVVSLGLVGYIIWRFVQAIKDPDDKGTDAEGLVKRTGYIISGLTYTALAFLAGRIALGMGGGSGGGGGSTKQELTAQIMAQPFGQWAIGIVGVIVVGVGLYHFYRAYEATFMEHYKTGEMSADEQRAARRIGQFGLSARGVTFCIIGVFVVQAAMREDPDRAAQGLGGALSTLAQQPYGPWLLGVVAAGFIAYGIYCFTRTRYRTFNA